MFEVSTINVDACVTPPDHGLVNMVKNTWILLDSSSTAEEMFEATRSISKLTGVSHTIYFSAPKEKYPGCLNPESLGVRKPVHHAQSIVDQTP